LVAAAAAERAGALQAYARTLTHQDRVGVERSITALEKGAPDANAKLLDGLRDKVRALEERISVLEARRVDPSAAPASEGGVS
jgi:BMFP domain-containing protein YqiC